jgi:hypothetical protein
LNFKTITNPDNNPKSMKFKYGIKRFERRESKILSGYGGGGNEGVFVVVATGIGARIWSGGGG